ncbi:hypothetical protein RHMOL_Rhmol07G0024300 [Rhododendron molle]|uniref:Uncharacterized protein n=1 Tax=Rhododendron molle TaxID=49168 RepID=A0ACC0MX66_RHOML|nr:hypothetical protein RHMOL_Rhmol07G0024300 [Rhododendron molle]
MASNSIKKPMRFASLPMASNSIKKPMRLAYLPAASNSVKKPTRLASLTTADAAASWYYCAVVFMALILLFISFSGEEYSFTRVYHELLVGWRGSNQLFMNRRPCEEIYVVGQGETLHTIGEKCGDPFVVEQNPHIHDPDDVFPGLVIKITPTKNLASFVNN